MGAWLKRMATFFHLPREDVVFSLILPRLSSVEVWRLRLVSRQFLRLCDEYLSTFCRSVAYDEEELTSGEEILRGRACVMRTLRACTRLGSVSLRLFRRQEWNGALERSLERARSSLMAAVCELQPGCQLQSLSLVSVSCSWSSDLRSAGWGSLGERCAALTKLHLEDLSPFDDNCFRALLKNCKSLVHLTIKSVPRLRGYYLPILAPQLISLNLSGCHDIEGESLYRTVRSCHYIQDLDLSSLFSAVGDVIILVVKEFCPRLQSLRVSHCPRVTRRFLAPLEERGVQVTGGPNIERDNHKYQKILGQI